MSVDDYQIRRRRIIEWYKCHAEDKPLKYPSVSASTDSERFAGQVIHVMEQMPIHYGDGRTKEKFFTAKKNICNDIAKAAEKLAKQLEKLRELDRLNLSISNEKKLPLCDPLEYVNFIKVAAEVEIGEILGNPSEHILSVKPDHNPAKQTKYNRQIGYLINRVLRFYKQLQPVNATNMAALLRAMYDTDLEESWQSDQSTINDAYYQAVKDSGYF
ncbi:hypothetical protein KW441_13545 [Vibrio fluvialis]|nr:hypothetical protein [Vibrio fluvialis]